MNTSHMKLVVAGGGGVATKSRPFLEAALGLTNKAKPNVLLIPTAKFTAQTHESSVKSFRATYETLFLPRLERAQN